MISKDKVFNAYTKENTQGKSNILGNRDGDSNALVTELDGLSLAAADEPDLIVFQPKLVEFHEDNDGENPEDPVVVEEKEDENEEEVVDIKEIREKLKQSYETILYYSLPMDDQDRSILKTTRKKLDEIRSVLRPAEYLS
ncbi:hypothetical protein PS15p_210180 [Mucor circinelloides]